LPGAERHASSEAGDGKGPSGGSNWREMDYEPRLAVGRLRQSA
jgi:hypothetical protein